MDLGLLGLGWQTLGLAALRLVASCCNTPLDSRLHKAAFHCYYIDCIHCGNYSNAAADDDDDDVCHFVYDNDY